MSPYRVGYHFTAPDLHTTFAIQALGRSLEFWSRYALSALGRLSIASTKLLVA